MSLAAISLATLTLQPVDLGLGGLLVAATLAMLALQGIGLSREVTLHTLRGLIQVLLLGGVLVAITHLDRWYWVILTLFLMTLLATHRATTGISRPVPFLNLIALASIGTTVFVVVGFFSTLVLHIEPWHSPLHVVPLAGMVLANAMNGFSLFTERFARRIYENQDEVEAKLSLGADIRESIQGPMRDALRTAMLPLGNLLLVIGIIQIPGIMAGQLFAGASPMTSVGFAVLMIEAAVASILISALMAGMLIYPLFFTPALQLKESLN